MVPIYISIFELIQSSKLSSDPELGYSEYFHSQPGLDSCLSVCLSVCSEIKGHLPYCRERNT